MKSILLNILPISLIILTVFSVQQWLKIPVSSTFIVWGLNFFILYIILRFIQQAPHTIQRTIQRYDLYIINIFMIWTLFNCIRGGIIADNYWEWKQLITGMLTLSLPLFIFIFSIPAILNITLHFWFKFALIIFVCLLPFLGTQAYHFYLGPLFLIGCFIPLLPSKWKIVIAGLLVIMVVINLGARSQVLKALMVLFVALGVYYKRFFSIRIFHIVHWACYIIPIILLFLGISGRFNIFEDLASHKGKYTESKIVNGKIVEEDLSADTRTFIYQEVITSAVKHHYVIWGRTPARGNDSMNFGKYTADELKTGKYERHSNEVCHPNVFTWLGLIGVVLYSLIYLRSSYLAVYKSKNIYMKFLGCFIAFRWAYGWIEDFNRFDIMNISLWMMIAMGISISFRNMTNVKFRRWIKNIFITGNEIKTYRFLNKKLDYADRNNF